MRFRIAINLGDVMVDGADIYGDGVNIAARLQELAEPGGVVISSPVYDQVHGKLSVGFDCLGQQQMKNVAPVVSYRVAMTGPANAEGRSSWGDAPASPAGAPKPRDAREPSTRMDVVSQWLANLPRPIAGALVVSGFLVLINLFTSPHRLWFHWPVAALLFVVVLRRVLRRDRTSDRKEDR
jgi:adenylate cyclase